MQGKRSSAALAGGSLLVLVEIGHWSYRTLLSGSEVLLLMPGRIQPWLLPAGWTPPAGIARKPGHIKTARGAPLRVGKRPHLACL